MAVVGGEEARALLLSSPRLALARVHVRAHARTHDQRSEYNNITALWVCTPVLQQLLSIICFVSV